VFAVWFGFDAILVCLMLAGIKARQSEDRAARRLDKPKEIPPTSR
jgi:hypothetical protein